MAMGEACHSFGLLVQDLVRYTSCNVTSSSNVLAYCQQSPSRSLPWVALLPLRMPAKHASSAPAHKGLQLLPQHPPLMLLLHCCQIVLPILCQAGVLQCSCPHNALA